MKSRTCFIRVGIGGWTYAPWRDNFYPSDLVHARELEYASRQVTAIEINGTYYSTQKPATFARWAAETPDDFIFSVKAPRYSTNRRILAEAGESVERFINSGIAELGKKLGPILWQFAPTKHFDIADMTAFLALLPTKIDGVKLRHVLDVRHDSFMTPDFFKLTRKYKVASVFTDSPDYPSFADFSTDFVYIRLMCSESKTKSGYPPKALDAWAARVKNIVDGLKPADGEAFPNITAQSKQDVARDVFLFFINGAKERAPDGAIALLKRLG
ncbi:DUF72 domain-containing protein [Glaciimonas sp. PAMC28666]|uniref:DUF72 domain-containing protein n=1 Tax=Glaciimonas sp. PAMC28666 TaxID=2807626 RepID=UPI001963259F|nr:DUF72 domain-containing protein [Glaciimonas sp. PAMC28666]QRX81900.1 DUF72 domain-containing protein [Glaciimonas sp. PAMC28666]